MMPATAMICFVCLSASERLLMRMRHSDADESVDAMIRRVCYGDADEMRDER